MNRLIFAVVVGLGVAMTGCAASVDEPVPPPPAVEEQRPPPNEELSTKLRDPTAQLIDGMGIDRGLEGMPVLVKPHGPLPDPEDK